jgi:hypothetical protein
MVMKVSTSTASRSPEISVEWSKTGRLPNGSPQVERI